MRVNVTYSVELEEVKQIVTELLHKVEQSAENINIIFPQIVEVSGGSDEKKAVKLIEKCREDLLKLDHSLFDCQNILTGYQQTVLQSGENGVNNMQGMQNNLTENLNKMKEMLNAESG